MSRSLHHRSRLADLLLAVVAVIALDLLGGCGIKGPLRLPPPAAGSAPASSPSGAAPAPATAPAQPPEEIHAEPPAVPAEPADPRKP